MAFKQIEFVGPCRARVSSAALFALLSLGACAEDGGGAPEEASDTEASTEESGADESTGEELDDSVMSEDEVQIVLTWLGPLPDAPPEDPSNAYADDPGAAALGQALFYDARYSGNGEVSCATCHAADEGFGDGRANTSLGISRTGRSSPSLFNGAYGAAAEDDTNWQLWDGRADSQWSQALGPPESAVVMGGTRTAVALLINDEYAQEYEEVFGPLPTLRDEQGEPLADPSFKPGMKEWDALDESLRDDVTTVYVNFGKSIAAYERLLVSRNSRFDAYWRELEAGVLDSEVLNEEEILGLRLFIGKARCLGCHSGPNFTDNQFHNIGVPQAGDNIPEMDVGRAGGVTKLVNSGFNCASSWSDHPNPGQCAVDRLSEGEGEEGAFKTPSLRSINLSPPYMHTGMFPSLESVIQHYDLGGAPNGTFDGARDELIRPLALDANERRALVAFILTLEGEPLDASLTGSR